LVYNLPMAPLPDLTLDEALRLRLRAQCLHPETALTNPRDLAAHLCGLQAQDTGAGTLSFCPRTDGLTARDVDRARGPDRSIVRTWVMRTTLHFIAAGDVRWLLALLSPRSIAGTRRRREQLGLTEPIVERGIAALRDLLSGGPLPRPDLIAALSARGLPTEGQAGIHLLARAALEGVICYGPDADGAETFTLLDDWLRAVPQTRPADPLAALARRYLSAYAPASPADFAYWAGITLTDARAGFDRLGDNRVAVTVAGQPAWLLPAQSAWLGEPAGPPIVRLLPRYDTYLLGWRDREAVLPAAHAKRIHPGGGILHPAVLVDGRIIARWRSKKRASGLAITVEPFEPLDASVRDLLSTESTRIERFLDTNVTLSVDS
jgi:hypothetical protein